MPPPEMPRPETSEASDEPVEEEVVVEVVSWICFTVLAISGLLCVRRVVTGDSVADRIIALDTLLIVIVVGVGVAAARTGSGTYLDVLLVVALVAFIGTTSVARFIERRGPR